GYVGFWRSYLRRYPQKDVAAHIVGHVGAVTREELTGDPLLEIPDFKIGKTGVEKAYDLAMRGRAGTMQVEVNAFGRVIRNLSREPGRRGEDLSLTIDMPLQRFAMKRLAREKSAAAVAMDIHNGEVFALASTPSYDPNAFIEGMTTEEWRTLSTDTLSPLQNKCAAGLYHPGSTIKQMVMLAALEAGVDPKETVFCRGHYEYEDERFHCWKRSGHGHTDAIKAIAESCDVYFYEMALRIGIDRIAAMMRRFGLGAPIGIDFGAEAGGVVPTRDWKLANIGDRWRIGDTIVASIGQGYMLSTPLQLAVMQARLVNGGYAVRPRLSRMLFEEERGLYAPGAAPPIGIPRAHLDLVKRGTDDVVNHNAGTARKLKIENPAFAFGGKTGTAQVRRITMAERERGVRKNEDLPWEQRDHALFVGYAPLAAPRYAVSVVVEHGGGGSAVAAPLARELLIAALRRDPSKGAPRPGVAQAG
ncbi:MAG: penicillin-binding protein 2, partial [Pseudomonadota bacterium]